MEVIEELHEEISQLEPDDPEREELERTLAVCRDFAYAIAEGFISVEEDEEEEMHFFPEAECFHAPLIEA